MNLDESLGANERLHNLFERHGEVNWVPEASSLGTGKLVKCVPAAVFCLARGVDASSSSATQTSTGLTSRQ